MTEVLLLTAFVISANKETARKLPHGSESSGINRLCYHVSSAAEPLLPQLLSALTFWENLPEVNELTAAIIRSKKQQSGFCCEKSYDSSVSKHRQRQRGLLEQTAMSEL